jgi:TolB-like protein/class 3 adenylate cyclase/cytochrome c-type biogenesis protein CcmH/NrfG
MQQQTRRLAAILFTDIVGSTSMMQKDEQHAISINKRYVAVLKECVLPRGGEILNDFGDGSLCTFHSATEALRCAIEMQQQFQLEPKVPLRIGLHVGEIFFEDGKVFGDGVNVASRVQSLGIANSILFSSQINSQIKNQQEFKSVSVGRFHFKNVDEPMEVFALTNEGLTVPKKEELTGKLKEIEIESLRKKLIVVAVALLLLITGFFLYKQFFGHTDFAEKEKSIAVLPFTNMGNDKANEYFSDGMTDEIITQVSKIPSLKVISRTSAMQYKNSTKSLKQIAEDLGVSFVLEGEIEISGDSVRINARLIEASSDQHIWGDKYDRNIKELFTIQSEVAENIANALQTKLTPEQKKNLSKHYTENIEAYKLYRKGRWFWDKRDKVSYDSAEANYQRAIELDPDYALAYSGLADCYIYNQQGLSQMEGIQIARDYTNKALLLDSNLAEALTTKAFIQAYEYYGQGGANEAFKKIIRDNPNYAFAHLYYGNDLSFTGNSAAAINETKKALALDPLSSVINMVLGRDYYYARNYDQAIIQLQKTKILNPNFKNTYWVLGNIFIQKKLYSQAIDAYSKLPPTTFELGLNGTLLLSYAYAASGDKIKAKSEFDKISKEDYTKVDPTLVAQFYISLGNFNEALTQLERGFNLHSILMSALKVEPPYDPIRNEPRFKILLRKMNLE